MPTRRWLRLLVCMCAVAAMLLSGRASGATPKGSPAPGVLGDYAGAIRESTPRADGVLHVDTPATIRALRRLHVNTYAYLIWNDATDWSDLVNEFLPAAEQAHINVWVYLVPPSECCSQPYGADFVAWARAIAQESRHYPNLTAWVIDDFEEESNLETLTPSYMAAIQAAAHSVNPALPFYPIIYPGEYSSTFLDQYSPYIDGAIFPYTGDPSALDLNNLGTLSTRLDAAGRALRPLHKRLFLMPYAAPIGSAPHPPSAKTVSDTIRVGLKFMRSNRLDGVVTFAAPLQPAVESCASAGYSHYLALEAPWNTPTPGGDYASATQRVTVDPRASSATISFESNDSFLSYPSDLGYYQKQLLVNGSVVWQQDVAADPANTWAPVTVDLGSLLQGATTATVEFRLTNPKGVRNFGVGFYVTDVAATGLQITNGDIHQPYGWSFATSTAEFVAESQSYICDPDRQRHVLHAIASAYATAHIAGVPR